MDRPKSSNGRNVVEELSKQSYEVVLPLVASVRKEFQADQNLCKSAGDDSDQSDQDDDRLSDQEDDGSPKCNTWKGQNYKLHVLGQYDNDFQKHLKAFQIPETVEICTDPSGRSGVSCEYPPIEEAFLLWKAKPGCIRMDGSSEANACLNSDFFKEEKDDEQNSVNSSDDIVQPLKILSLVNISSSEDEDDSSVNGNNCWKDGPESDTESEISEYIKSQRLKKKQGVFDTGETLVYDEDFEAIRNLHKSSISLSSYGKFTDNKIFGKTCILFDQLTPREKLMLRPLKSCNSSGDQQLFEGKSKIGKDSSISMNGDGAGDCDNDTF